MFIIRIYFTIPIFNNGVKSQVGIFLALIKTHDILEKYYNEFNSFSSVLSVAIDVIVLS